MIDSLRPVKSHVVVAPILSVLVRVKNEMKALPEFWKRLASQSILPRTEVLFLDSGSIDGTLEFLQSLPVSIYQIRPEDFCYGSACNLLMSISNAPIACFLSGHVFLEGSDALGQLHSVLVGKKRAAAYLRQAPDEIFGANYYERAYLRRRYPDHKGKVVEMFRPAGFSNAGSALTRDAWTGNPFPEIHGGEDSIWAKELLRGGGKILYVSGVTAMHSHRDSAASTYRRVQSYAKARGDRGSYGKALYFFGGVLFSMMRIGSSPREALQYAAGHARGYLPHNLRSVTPRPAIRTTGRNAGAEDAAMLRLK